jgi:hypothetical protein
MNSPNGFQNVVNDYQAPAVPGDFASTNPFASIVAGPGALVAPAGGLLVGNFAWVGPNGQVSQSYVAGYQVGFLGRNQQALITQFLGRSTMLVPEGFMVTLFNEGDFWAQFPAGATIGQNVYADPNDGTPLSGASAPTLGTGTATAGFTGDGTLVNTSTTLTVTTATHGVLSPGDAISGTDIPSGTTILAQLTVTGGSGAGLEGTYQMSAAATATVSSPEAIVGESSYALITAVADGAFNFGDVFSGTDVAAGTSIQGQATPFSGVATVGTLPSTPSTALNVTSVQPGTDLLRVGATITGVGIAPGTTIASQTSGTPGGVGVYVMSANSTAEAAGVAITTADSAGGTGLYNISNGPQAFGAASAPITITVAGTAQSTGFKVRGTMTAVQQAGNNGVWKISTN